MRSAFLRVSLTIATVLVAMTFSPSARAAGTTTKITLDPAVATVTADQPQTYKVLATASDGTMTDVTDQSTLSTNDPTGQAVGAVYTPGQVGSWSVQASYQSFTATAAVTVTPGAVVDVVVNPNSNPEQITINTTAAFTALAYDAKNNIVSGATVTWSVIGPIGTIDAHGVFSAKSVGTGKVQAVSGTVTGQVSLVVSQPVVTNTAAVVKNTNTPKNTNTGNVNAAITNASAATKTSSSSCTTLKPWAWILLLVVFMFVVALLYALVPVAEIWPVVVALIAAGVLAYIQRKYACHGQLWWAWVVTLGTLALTGLAWQMNPKKTPPSTM